MFAYFLNYFLKKEMNGERKGNFNITCIIFSGGFNQSVQSVKPCLCIFQVFRVPAKGLEGICSQEGLPVEGAVCQ